MPHLDQRLKVVAQQIRCVTHADIGSDHGHLLKALLASGRIQRGIAIENKRQPYENSRSTLTGFNADVRLADGLEGLDAGEADSLSICGMGGELIVRILDAHPDRVPATAIIQPNRRPERVREWALRTGYHLTHETTAQGHWRYIILRFERPKTTEQSGQVHPDPAYKGLDREAALLFGPHLLRHFSNDFAESLEQERRYLRSLPRLAADAVRRLEVIDRIL
ncbi:tRNA (adenine(22)-N(1))-methyltransferase [Rhodopirellula sallentina]|uniref:Protein containing DUF633 n=1 Tax=Rhodopirellula sallentina SM41 TaxID=1263870 RepID=M5UIE4_9BACT|nr:class I SAM-dependent methyltransferase [Rhodopirellula sallentina]EMI55788.1 protein containing DUF633 [Rhodopirellula sallentina SM41]